MKRASEIIVAFTIPTLITVGIFCIVVLHLHPWKAYKTIMWFLVAMNTFNLQWIGPLPETDCKLIAAHSPTVAVCLPSASWTACDVIVGPQNEP